jgi:hypothetical protein
MASAAQFEANRLKFGLFSTQNCVRPEETQEYTKLSKALWKDLNPVGPVEQMLAVEIVRAAWRLHRCTVAEAEDGVNPVTQASIDRARASAHNSMRRLLNDLRQFQSDRWLRAEILREGFNEAYYGIADAHRVIKGLVDDSRLRSQTVQTQLFGQVGQASWPVKSPGETPAPTNRTQSEGQVGQALSPGNPDQHPSRDREGAVGPNLPTLAPPIPRNAPCPCHSSLKYKRCCGATAPPALTFPGPGSPGSALFSGMPMFSNAPTSAPRGVTGNP